MVFLNSEQIRALSKLRAETYTLEESHEKPLHLEVTVWKNGRHRRYIIAPNGRTHG